MDGIDRIIDRIKSDAETESATAIASAEREAEETVKRFEEDAAKQAEEMMRSGAAQAEERLQRLSGVAGLEAGKNLLAAKQEMIDAAFTRAGELIADYDKEEYIAFLSALAVRYSRTGFERVLLSENDRERCGEEVLQSANALLVSSGRPGALSLSGEAAKIGGGLILRDGELEINCSIEAILHFMRDRVSGEIAGILFG